MSAMIGVPGAQVNERTEILWPREQAKCHAENAVDSRVFRERAATRPGKPFRVLGDRDRARQPRPADDRRSCRVIGARVRRLERAPLRAGVASRLPRTPTPWDDRRALS